METILGLLQRYFPEWEPFAGELSVGINKGNVYVGESREDVQSTVGPWWLIQIGYAVARLEGRPYADERKRIEAMWAQEPV